MNATAGSRPGFQEEGEEVSKISKIFQMTTGAAFATATVSTSASGSTNFSRQIKVLVDTGNLLTIGMCISEAFYVSLGGQLRDLSPPSFHTANGASENSTMHVVGDTHVYIKCANFNNVMLSGPAVVLRGLKQEVIIGMNFLRDNCLNLDLSPTVAHLIHAPTQQKQKLVAQITQPRNSPSRSRSTKKQEGGGG